MNDREKLIELVDEAILTSPAEVCAIADHLIANGVVVREKGEWELLPGGFKWRCSACGSKVNLDGTPEENGLYFCSNCGADMRGGKT